MLTKTLTWCKMKCWSEMIALNRFLQIARWSCNTFFALMSASDGGAPECSSSDVASEHIVIKGSSPMFSNFHQFLFNTLKCSYWRPVWLMKALWVGLCEHFWLSFPFLFQCKSAIFHAFLFSGNADAGFQKVGQLNCKFIL